MLKIERNAYLPQNLIGLDSFHCMPLIACMVIMKYLYFLILASANESHISATNEAS